MSETHGRKINPIDTTLKGLNVQSIHPSVVQPFLVGAYPFALFPQVAPAAIQIEALRA